MGSKASGDVYFVLAEERPSQAEGTAQRRQAHLPAPNGLCLGRNSNSGQTSNSSEMGHRVTRGQSMTSLAVPLWEKAGKWSLSIIFLTSHWSEECLQKGGNGWPALWRRTPECAPNCRIWILGWTAFKRTNEILAWTLKGNYGIIFSCGYRNWWAQNGERCNY